jgi:NADH dehydrogenase
VVVIGAGFGGLSVARALRRREVDVVLVDQHNYHLFTPLLYEVGTALLDPSEIAYPVRGIFHHIANVDFKVGRVTGIDLEARVVRTAEGALDCDYLVVAAGSVNNFFGNESAAQHAFALKDLGEALALRNHVLAQFEEASWTDDPAQRRGILEQALGHIGTQLELVRGRRAELHQLEHELVAKQRTVDERLSELTS